MYRNNAYFPDTVIPVLMSLICVMCCMAGGGETTINNTKTIRIETRYEIQSTTLDTSNTMYRNYIIISNTRH